MPQRNCFLLNAATITVASSATVPISVRSYTTDDDLWFLRDRYRSTHFVKRGGDCILIIPLTLDAEQVGEVEQTDLREHPRLVAPLLLEALLRYFRRLDRPVLKQKPLRMISTRPEDMLLRRSTPGGTALPAWLEQKVGYVFDTRIVYPEQRHGTVLLACDVKTFNFVSASCAELLGAGLPLENRVVLAPATGGDPRLLPKLNYAGRVLRVEGETLILTDHTEGNGSVDASAVHLEPSYENLVWCVRSLAGESADRILARLDTTSAAVNAGKGKLQRIESMLNHLRKEPIEIAPGVQVTFGPTLELDGPWFPATEVLKRPPLLFDPGGRRSDPWAERGIDEHGPYDRTTFTPRKPRIAVICQSHLQGRVEQFVAKFLDGMPLVTGGTKRKPYEKGFARRFGLEQPEVQFFPAAGPSPAAYRAACLDALRYASEHQAEWHLALVQNEEAFLQCSGDDDPYLVTKSVFMKRQVPVQEIEIESMVKPDDQLVHILNNVSLAAYAKLGGTPWLLPANQKIAHELVVGLGSYQVARRSRFGTPERVVGTTTVFSGDGRYLLDSSTSAVPYDEYPDALLKKLRSAITKIRTDQNWQSRDTVRLIFHAFKPLKDAETIAVQQLMDGLGLPNAQYAFVHVMDDHPFLIFDEKNSGLRKGAYAPERGTLIEFNREEALLCFVGPRELKQATDGMPRSKLLRLHRNSTFKDITYLARQIFAFSCHSWRTFSPAPVPITILYSQLMAELLRKLQDVSDWDPEAMHDRIGHTRWFL